jgi:hypothetical protein
MELLFGIVVLSAIVIAAAAITAAGIALMRRDRTTVRSSGSLGNALQEIEGLFVESKRHELKIERAEEAEERTISGDPPEK